jgi:hypothetical protein
MENLPEDNMLQIVANLSGTPQPSKKKNNNKIY